MGDEQDSLKHYGVKGMRWGVKRSDAQLAAAKKTRRGKKEPPARDTVTSKRGRITKVDLSKKSSEMQPAQDAAKAAVTRQIAKKRSTDALSNDDLQALVKRMNLEQQYSDLSAKRKSTGRKYLEKFFKGQADSAVTNPNKFASDLSNTAKLLKAAM